MKKLLSLLLLTLFSNLGFAAIEDGVYYIICQQGEGYVALGAKHSMNPYICYVKDGGTIAADGYWIVTNTRSGYTFRNEVSGEYIIFTEERDDAFYKYMTLASTAPEDKSQYWSIHENEDGSQSIQSLKNENYWWNLRFSQGLLGTYSGSSGGSANERYYLRKKGTEPDPNPDPEEPEVMTKFPEAVHVFLTDGRIQAFPKSIITSREETDNQLVIKTSIGQDFTYPLSQVSQVSEQVPTDFPTFESFKFNNKFNDQLFTDAEGEMVEDTVFVTVTAIGKRLTPSFKVPDDQTLVYVNGELQESKVTRRRFEKDTYYVVTREGITMLLPESTSETRGETTYSWQPYGRMVRVHVDWPTDQALVPRIDIVTEDGQPITSKTEYKNATITIDGQGIFPSMETTNMQIKGRGNSSWGWTKKPYRLKFEEKVKPLGMTKGKSWVLLSNGQKGSLMSNAVGMKAANLMGASAANHIVPVDLYLNGEYRGSYNLTEKVGFSNNSVDLEDETAAALLELDSYYDEPDGQKFRSTPYGLPINIKEPEFEEDETRLTLEMVRDDFNSFMATLYQGEDISQHVDVEQLVRFLMVNELICNFELYHPKSTFCYRESFESDTSKYVFGPVWDLDWAFGYEQNRNYFKSNTTSNYWLEMPNFEVKQFIQDLRWKYEPMADLYKQLWEKFLDEDLEELKEFCKDYYDFARNSFNSNASLWGDNTDYAQQATDAANWLDTRANKIYEDILNGIRPEPVKPIEPIEFADNKLYTITCRRGGLCLTEDHTGLEAQQVREADRFDWQTYTYIPGTPVPDEEKRFAIINIDGDNYLYSPVTKGFLLTGEVSNGQWVDYLGSPIYFDTYHPDDEYIFMITSTPVAGSTLWFNNSSSSLVINTWDKPDEGNRWKIEEVADFDPTEAYRIANKNLYAVTTNLMYDGEVIASESKEMPYGASLPEPPSDWSTNFVMLKPVGTHPTSVTEETTVAYEAVWAGPFDFTSTLDDAHWYNMTIRTEYVVGKLETEPYYPVTVNDPDTLKLKEFQWAFGGNPYKIMVYNRSTGLDQTLTKDGDNAVMRPGKYLWELIPNQDGFVLRIEGTPSTCINQFGGKTGALQFWDSGRSLTDDGSTFRVTPAPELYDRIDVATTTAPSTTIYDLSGRRLDHIRKPGIYIINGKKVVVK